MLADTDRAPRMLADTDRAPSSDLSATNPVVADNDDGNPSDGGLPLGPELSEAEDTNAVVSPTHQEFFLTRVAGAFLATPFGVPYVWLLTSLFMIVFNTWHEGEVSALTRMLDVCVSVGGMIFLVGSAISLRRVTGTGAGRGQLAALGAGEARISERARRSLGRAHVLLCAVGVPFIMAGLLCLVTATRVGTRSKLTGRVITAAYAQAVFLAGLMFFNVALVFAPW